MPCEAGEVVRVHHRVHVEGGDEDALIRYATRIEDTRARLFRRIRNIGALTDDLPHSIFGMHDHLKIEEPRPELLQYALGYGTLPLSGACLYRHDDNDGLRVPRSSEKRAHASGDHIVVFQIQRKDDQMHHVLVPQIMQARIPIESHVVAHALEIVPEMYGQVERLEEPIYRKGDGQVCRPDRPEERKRHEERERRERKYPRQHLEETVETPVAPDKVARATDVQIPVRVFVFHICLEPLPGLEPGTFSLQKSCSTN